MKYHFKVHREGTGFWTECIELEGCRTQGDSLEELQSNMHEALNLYLDEPEDSKRVSPLPKKGLKGRGIVTVEVEPKIAFALLLRRHRLTQGMTQREVADKMGFKNIYSYQRLENSKTANPEFTTILLIKRIFPKFSLDEIIAA